MLLLEDQAKSVLSVNRKKANSNVLSAPFSIVLPDASNLIMNIAQKSSLNPV